MSYIKNSAAGFAVSFMGAIPFGYLNLIALKIFSGNGWISVLSFASGIVLLEIPVIYFTLMAAQWLLAQKQLIKALQITSVVFLCTMSVYFFSASSKPLEETPFVIHNFFATGIILSAINFMQLPFWCGWNLVLLNSKKISMNVPHRLVYVLSAGVGTITAVCVFVFVLNQLSGLFSVTDYLINISIAIIMLLLAAWQLYRHIKSKYLSISSVLNSKL